MWKTAIQTSWFQLLLGFVLASASLGQEERVESINALWQTANREFAAGQYDAAFQAATQLCEQAPDNLRCQLLRGDIGFAAGQFDESVAAYDAAIKIRSDIAPELWQRGLSLYYAQRFDDGVKQFETHQTVNSQDVENAVWHLLCAARVSDVEAARKKLIPISEDTRIPMSQIYDLFAGRQSIEGVMAAAKKTTAQVAADGPRHRLQLYYAHLYIALYHEMLGDQEATLKSLEQAVDVNPLGKTNFMGQVARVHLEALKGRDK